MISEQKLKILFFWKNPKNIFEARKNIFSSRWNSRLTSGFFCAWVPERLLYACAILEQVQGYKFSCESDLELGIHTKSVTYPWVSCRALLNSIIFKAQLQHLKNKKVRANLPRYFFFDTNGTNTRSGGAWGREAGFWMRVCKSIKNYLWSSWKPELDIPKILSRLHPRYVEWNDSWIWMPPSHPRMFLRF